ncbi:3-hydroxyacyl-CoA dehydrogenase/enoyl-CoA hydratase family protein [Lachnospiraceae bacterium ZAX-1]
MKIRKVGIIGSGTMGSGLASHLANAGIPSYLFDIVPTTLTDSEVAAGLSLASPKVRYRIVESNKQNFVIKMKPSGLMSGTYAELIRIANLEDDLALLSECDWIVEIVAENLEIKKSVLAKIQPFVQPGTLVSSNTSGISINRISEDMPLEFRQHWCGTHFFNPIRYMKLVEMIPSKDILPEAFLALTEFCEKTLGKTPVVCKDTPNFIANRLGVALGADMTRLTEEYDLTFDEADSIAGPAIGRPKTAAFKLYDMVGLDIGTITAKTVQNNIDDPKEKELFAFPPFIDEMMKDNRLGHKTGGGFYKRQGRGKGSLVYDYKTKEYVPAKPVVYQSVLEALKKKSIPDKLEIMLNGSDVASEIAWKHIKCYFLHAASLIPEISDNILNMDRAMVLGYNHLVGPFETWNGIDIGKYVDRMEKEGETVPAWVKEMLASGITSFYMEKEGKNYYYSILDKKYVPIETPFGMIILKEEKAKNKRVLELKDADVYDIGDDILCLEITSKNAALSVGLVESILVAQEELNKNWAGMVIASGGKNFCVGADLREVAEYIKAGNFTEISKRAANIQNMTMGLKYSPKPVVAATYGQVLGGGCELAIQCGGVQSEGETYMGLVEVGVGLVPSGGGVKEMTLRALERTEGTMALKTEFLLAAFDSIASGKVSSSGPNAKELGYLRKTDKITLGAEWLINDAKTQIQALISTGYKPPVKKAFPCPGKNDNALLIQSAKMMKDGHYVSEYDYYIAQRIAFIMTGGDVSKNQLITEEYLLSLEREIFVELCKETKTKERVSHMLTTGKPLRN